MKFHHAMAAALLAATAGAQPAEPVPYGLRGARLGVTLDEFRMGPIPPSKYEGSTGVACSDDPPEAGAPELTPKDAAAGIVRCQWILYRPGEISWLTVDIANARAGVHFDFLAAPGEPPRLFRISAEFGRGQWDDLVPSFEHAYGKPKVETESVQNGAGAHFVSTKLLWSNGVSQIRIDDRCGSIDGVCLTLVHGGLAIEYTKRAQSRAVEGATRL